MYLRLRTLGHLEVQIVQGGCLSHLPVQACTLRAIQHIDDEVAHLVEEIVLR